MTVMVDSEEEVVLVDEQNQKLGIGAKIETHQKGLLHRAFSIFLFSPDGHTLVQRRAMTKYHSSGEWANTCCGHPRPCEPVLQAAHRRLNEELGMRAELFEAFTVRYSASLKNSMIENEFVHVFVGMGLDSPQPNPTEVCEYAYVDLDDLLEGKTVPCSQQTAWMRHYLDNHFEQLVLAKERILETSASH